MKTARTGGFTDRYPISIFAVLMSFISFQEKYASSHGLLPPHTGAMRFAAEHAGYTYGHLRTILSIWKREGLLVTTGKSRSLRWSFGSRMQAVRANLDYTPSNSDDALTFIVFSFSGNQEKKRRTAHEILGHFRFKIFAPNVYVSTMGDAHKIREALRGFGLLDNVFVFRTDVADNPHALARLRRIWGVDEFATIVRDFLGDMRAYLKSPASGRETFLRHQFASASFHENILLKTPALPRALFTPPSSLESITRALDRFETTHLRVMLEYYRAAGREDAA